MKAVHVFGGWLKLRRKGLGLTQKELAAQVGYAAVTLRKVEADELRPSRQMAQKLAEALELTPEEQAQFVRFARNEAHWDDITLPALVPSSPIPPTPLSEEVASYLEQALGRPLEQLEGLGPGKPQPGRNVQVPAVTQKLFGRHQELVDIVQCLTGPDCRLLDLVGPGGIGKTRLAIETAHTVAGHFAHGIHWVNLQPIQAADGLVIAIADALAMSLSGQGTDEAQLLHYLRNKELLLVLDNFEHLAAAAQLLVEIVEQAPRVTLLVTSREAIHLQSEWLYPIGSLAYPPSTATAMAEPVWEDVESYAAVQLFVARARQLQPAFVPGAQCGSIVRICQLTAGMPLALELAASWVASLTCTEIADEIANDLAMLTTRMRDVPERHRTMSAVFQQSWQRLCTDEQGIFQRLVVFRGGFRREAAQEVAGATVPALASLNDHSFLVQGADGRYQIHELLRELGETQLAASANELAQARERHCAYYAELMSSKAAEMLSGNSLGAVGQLSSEMDNIRAAWRWAIEQCNAGAIRKSALALYSVCQVTSRFQEGFLFMRAAAEALPADDGNVTVARAECYLYAGWLAMRLGRLEDATWAANRSLLLQRTSGVALVHGWANTGSSLLSLLARMRGDHRGAVQLATEAYQACKLSSDFRALLLACYALTSAHMAQGKLDAAAEAIGEAVSICRQYRVTWFLAHCLIKQGDIALVQGRLVAARQHFEHALAIQQMFSDPAGMSQALNYLGEVALQQNRMDEATTYFQASLELYADTNDLGGLATSEQGLGQVALRRGELEQAAHHYQNALQLAMRSSSVPLIMWLLNSVSELLLYCGRNGAARTLLTFVLDSGSSDFGAKIEARRLLEQCGSAEESEQVGQFTLDQTVALAASAMVDGNTSPAGGTQRETHLRLTVARVPAPESNVTPGALVVEGLIEPLTAREMAVLHLLAAGRSNQNIAAQFIIAPGTAKWYVSQILGKLGVHSRTQAIARAQKSAY